MSDRYRDQARSEPQTALPRRARTRARQRPTAGSNRGARALGLPGILGDDPVAPAPVSSGTGDTIDRPPYSRSAPAVRTTALSSFRRSLMPIGGMTSVGPALTIMPLGPAAN